MKLRLSFLRSNLPWLMVKNDSQMHKMGLSGKKRYVSGLLSKVLNVTNVKIFGIKITKMLKICYFHMYFQFGLQSNSKETIRWPKAGFGPFGPGFGHGKVPWGLLLSLKL